MLREAIEHYVDGVRNERELDAPVLALLAAMNFYDIHFTHGISEFGKDYIGKLDRDGVTVQYAFQAKSGNIGTSKWRDVKQQLIEATVSGLSHPAFDASLRRQIVLVTNGRLVGNAPIDVAETNRFLTDKLKSFEIITWDREVLIDLFERHGPEHIHASVGRQDFAQFGKFLACYADAYAGSLSERAFERYSVSWTRAELNSVDRLTLAILEAALIAEVCLERELPYISVHVTLAAYRAVLFEVFQQIGDAPSISLALVKAVELQIERQVDIALSYYRCDYDEPTSEFNLLRSIGDNSPFVTYPVHCLRKVELLGIQYRLKKDPEKSATARELANFVSTELAASRPLSDWYAVSIVIACSALAQAGLRGTAIEYIRRSAAWVFDRYDADAIGLASVDDSEIDELRRVVGDPFELGLRRNSSSLLVTAFIDLSCMFQSSETYKDLLADVRHCDISPVYFQVRDSCGLFFVEAEDVVVFPNISFASSMPMFEDLTHGEHITEEPRTFKLQSVLDSNVFVLLSMLLRDRYFPTTWVKMRDDS